jgi:hypothetical protein
MARSTPTPTPTYLPNQPLGDLGMGGGAPKQSNFQSPVGKRLRIHNLGNITGMRGAGLTGAGGGSQLAHSFNNYGKKSSSLEGSLSDLMGGSF